MAIRNEQKARELAKYLNVNVDEVKTIEGSYGYELYVVNGDQYYVLDEDEQYEFVKEDIKSLLEDIGLDAFSEWFQEWVLDTCIKDKFLFALADDISDADYDDYARMSNDEIFELAYDLDFITEEQYDKYQNDELSEREITKIRKDFIDDRIEDLKDEFYEDPYEWYDNVHGEGAFKRLVNQNLEECYNSVNNVEDIVDLESIVERCIQEDGMAHTISTYNEVEIELDNYCAYQVE